MLKQWFLEAEFECFFRSERSSTTVNLNNDKMILTDFLFVIGVTLGLYFVWTRFAAKTFRAKFAQRFRPTSTLFVMLAKLSLVEKPPTVQSMLWEPDYHAEHWDSLGLVPIANIRDLKKKVKVSLFKSIYNQFLDYPPNLDGFSSPAEVVQFTKPYFGDVFNRIPVPQSDDLSIEKLYEQIVVAGFYDLQPKISSDDQPLYSLDLQFLRDFPVKEWCYPCGGEAVISLDKRKVLFLISPEGQQVFPTDDEWALESFRFRSSLFQYCTVTPHSTFCHGVLGSKAFLAVYRLSEDHPLRTLLRPFVHDVDKNMSRAGFAVFNETGVLKLAGAFTYEGIQGLIARGRHDIQIKLLNELHLDQQVRKEIEPVWDAIQSLVTNFIEQKGISELDPEVREFKHFFVTNVDEQLNQLDLALTLTYVIFAMTVGHHLWGHIHYGSTDPRNVSAATRRVKNTVTTEEELYQVTESKDVGLLRMAVIVSTNRPHVKLSSDFSPTTTDPIAQNIFRSFHERMTILENEPHELIRLEDIGCSVMN